MRRVARRVLLAVGVLGTLAAGVLSAQDGRRTWTGVVRDAAGVPIVGARVDRVESGPVSVVPSAGPAGTLSDLFGRFRVSSLEGEGGEMRLIVRRPGFRPSVFLADTLDSGVEAEIILQRLAQPLPSQIVTGRREVRGPLQGFYQRREQGRGRFFTAEEIDRRSLRRFSDLMRGVPGVRAIPSRGGRVTYRVRGSSIPPLVWLDGMPLTSAELDLDVLDVRTFAGVEIYAGSASVPPQFTGGLRMSSSGGAIVLWTREGEAHRPRRLRRGEPSPAEVLARLLADGLVWTADAVDDPVRILPGEWTVPFYPDSLLDAGIPGAVEVEFVVDASGAVRMDTFGPVSATHPHLLEAVRRSLVNRRFVPARKAGTGVAQLVQYPVRFEPQPGVRTAGDPPA